MFVRLNQNDVLFGKNILDDKYDPDIKRIQIILPGIVVQTNNESTRTFVPWHRISLITGENGEHEHELAQFDYMQGTNDLT